MSIGKVIARAWADPAYKAKLLSDPAAALAEAGVQVPPGSKVKAVEDTDDTKHLVLPVRPVAPAGTDQVSDEELEKIAAARHGGGPSVDICL